MKQTISKRYTLFFGAISSIIIAVMVLSFVSLALREGDSLKRNMEATQRTLYDESQGRTQLNIARYLGRNLFPLLYQLDIEGINRIITDMKTALPILSFRVSDETGRVLTDGTKENASYGMRLRALESISRSSAALSEKIPEGQRITFAIRAGKNVAGYGEIVFSDEPLKTAMKRQDEIISETWPGFRKALLRISFAGIVIVLLIAALLSFIFSKTLSKPLMLLKDAANRVAKGDLGHSVNIDAKGEMGELASSFNQMVRDLKISTERLQEANRKLMELDRLKSEFVSVVSHEIRTPMTSIKAFSELILMKPNMPVERKNKMLTVINSECDRLTRLINDMLDITKIEAGRLTWRIARIGIEEIIHSAVVGLQSLADSKELHVSMRIEPQLPLFLGDRDRLGQVVTNILSNAVKFTPRGGSISIDAGMAHWSGPRIAVAVTDTGPGIPEGSLRLIFEKYHKVGDTLSYNLEGTGLGLAIARLIVEHHGGAIWAESTLGAGSTFTFTLPLDREWDAEAEQDSTSVRL